MELATLTQFRIILVHPLAGLDVCSGDPSGRDYDGRASYVELPLRKLLAQSLNRCRLQMVDQFLWLLSSRPTDRPTERASVGTEAEATACPPARPPARSHASFFLSPSLPPFLPSFLSYLAIAVNVSLGKSSGFRAASQLGASNWLEKEKARGGAELDSNQ